jgi:hypothetical protein
MYMEISSDDVDNAEVALREASTVSASSAPSSVSASASAMQIDTSNTTPSEDELVPIDYVGGFIASYVRVLIHIVTAGAAEWTSDTRYDKSKCYGEIVDCYVIMINDYL